MTDPTGNRSDEVGGWDNHIPGNKFDSTSSSVSWQMRKVPGDVSGSGQEVTGLKSAGVLNCDEGQTFQPNIVSNEEPIAPIVIAPIPENVSTTPSVVGNNPFLLTAGNVAGNQLNNVMTASTQSGITSTPGVYGNASLSSAAFPSYPHVNQGSASNLSIGIGQVFSLSKQGVLTNITKGSDSSLPLPSLSTSVASPSQNVSQPTTVFVVPPSQSGQGSTSGNVAVTSPVYLPYPLLPQATSNVSVFKGSGQSVTSQAVEKNCATVTSTLATQVATLAGPAVSLSSPAGQTFSQSSSRSGESIISGNASEVSSQCSSRTGTPTPSISSSVAESLARTKPASVSLHCAARHMSSVLHSISVGDFLELCPKCPPDVLQKRKKRAAVSLMEIGKRRLQNVLSNVSANRQSSAVKQETDTVGASPSKTTVHSTESTDGELNKSSKVGSNFERKDYSKMQSVLTLEVTAARVGPHKVNHFGPVIISQNGFDLCLDSDGTSTKVAIQIGPNDIRKCLAYLDVDTVSMFINTVEECGNKIKDQLSVLSLGPLKFDPRSPRQNIRYVTLAFDKFNKKQIDLYRNIMKEMSAANRKPEIAAIGGLYQEVDNVTTNSILKSVGLGNVLDIPVKKKRGLACLTVVDTQMNKRPRGRPPTYATTTEAGTSGTSTSLISAQTIARTQTVTNVASAGIVQPNSRVAIPTQAVNPGLTPIGAPTSAPTKATWVPAANLRPYTSPVATTVTPTVTTPTTMTGAVSKLTLPTKVMIAGQHKGVPLKEVDFDRNGIRFWFPESDPCSKIPACKAGVHIAVKDIFKVLAYMYPSSTSAIFVYLTPQFTATIGQMLRERIEFARFAHWECKAAHNPIVFLLDPSATSLDRSVQLQQVFNQMNKFSAFSPILSMINYQVATGFLQGALPSTTSGNNASTSQTPPQQQRNGVASTSSSSTSTPRRNLVNGREPRGGMAASNDPSSTIVIPVEKSEAEGDDLVMVAEEFSLKCPYSLQIMRNPMQNKNCKHNYDRDGVEQFLKVQKHEKGKGVRCPVVGCTNTKPLSLEDLVPNAQLKTYIQQNVAPSDIS